ncbi:polysaccharide deacetylase family protein [uncultured Duncaniella sp.]|uniref:polysaccharide deacetylase family protein n=1 Tax=uncultured Duncaniella sp. TaxID=2768039 RepID=UPI00262F3F42|nr:polysaccharide deacetylase family protein [uncultured Duncaniella sp.]
MNILTFDVEEWFHLLDNDSTRSEEQWRNYEVRIHENMERIFRILEDTDTRATFFVIGWIARTYPEIVRKIAEKYEIGSHTMNHQLVWQQTPEEFRQDVDSSVKFLEDLTGKRVRAFRAPGFSIRESESWAFETLHDLGIEIDCSVFPAHHAHGGFPSYGKAEPAIITSGDARIKEFPISCREMGGSHIIYQGGGYFRLFPYHLIKRWARRDSDYLLSYIHPRDLDAGQPMIEGLPASRKFKSYVGLKGAEKKLRKFLTDFQFTDLAEANAVIDWSKAREIKL